jgi:von Willebrand factor type A domain
MRQPGASVIVPISFVSYKTRTNDPSGRKGNRSTATVLWYTGVVGSVASAGAGPASSDQVDPEGVIEMSWVPAVIVATVMAAHDQPLSQAAKEPVDRAPAQSKAQPKPAPNQTRNSAPQSAARPAVQSKPGAKATSSPDQKPAPRVPASRSRQPAAADGPGTVYVRTQAEMEKPKSPFLMPPGSDPNDRYDPAAADWNEIPPWRRTSFFGIRERGQFFVYVVDSSGSMIDEARLPRATIELRRSILALQPPQRFEVIFYNHESNPMPGGPTARTADTQAKNLLVSWLRLIEPDGGTDPRTAMRQALGLKPDAVFLLSDGAYPQGTVEEITRLNARKVRIHCVDLTGGLAGDHLKRIAAANGGRYVARPLGEQGRH